MFADCVEMKLLFLSNYAHIVMPVSSMHWHAHHTLCGAQGMCYILWFSPLLLLLSVPNYRFLIPILKCSNTLNNTGVWSLIELASLYTVPLSAVNGLSRLTTTSNGQTRLIRKFSEWPIRIQIESRSFAGPYLKVMWHENTAIIKYRTMDPGHLPSPESRHCISPYLTFFSGGMNTALCDFWYAAP